MINRFLHAGLLVLILGWASFAFGQNECPAGSIPSQFGKGADFLGIVHQNFCIEPVTGKVIVPNLFSLTVTGPSTLSSVNNICIVDGTVHPATDVGIKACITALPTAGGTVLLPAGTYTISNTISINKANVEVRGVGTSSVISVNVNADIFNVVADYFILDDVNVTYALTTTRAGKALVKIGANNGNVRNLTISGNATSPNNGSIFMQNGTFGGWSFINIFLTEGPIAFWDSAISIVNGSAVANAASYFVVNMLGGGKFLAPAILLDGGIDTFQWTGGGMDALNGSTAPTIAVRNTVGGGIDPRWVHFNGVSIEADGSPSTLTGGQIDNVRDFQYYGYVAGAQTGFAVGANAKGVDIHDTLFTFIGQSAITVAAGALLTNIHHNYFDDTADAANNTYDTIAIAANANGINIEGNTWRNFNANAPRYGINIAAGTSRDITITGNISTSADHAFGTGFINNGSSGTNVNISDSYTGGLNFSAFNNNYVLRSANTNVVLFGSSIQRLIAGYILSWSASAADVTASTGDVNLNRPGPGGIVQVGTGETANANGKIAAADFIGCIGCTTPGAAHFATVATSANCSSAASPAVCAAAAAGSVAIANPATTIQVNTTAVTANSQIFVQEDSSLGTKLGVTCNTTAGRTYMVTARTAATSFTITASATPAANSACLSYFVVN